MEDEPTDLGSELELTSCHVAAGIREEIATSSTFADVEGMVEGMRNLFSQQEEVMAIQRSTGSVLRSGKGYKFNYDKPATPTLSALPPGSPSLVVTTRQDVNPENVNANVNERPIEPFKYDLVEHLKHLLARLHILDLLHMSKET